MGFIPKILVEYHVSASKEVMLKYPFKNKNGKLDMMYISLPYGYELVKKPMTLVDTATMEHELAKLERNPELKKIWGID